MEIKNHLLSGVPFKRSPNVGGLKNPTYIIIHYDAAPNATSAINWMTNKASKVSADLHIDRAGNVVQLAPFNVVTWHAGASEWKGINGLNSHSIGIELQNTGKQDYTQIQLDKLAEVCKLLVDNYPIKEILGHSDIAKGRKIDPGKQFPMEWLRSEVFSSDIRKTTADVNLRLNPSTLMPIIKVLKKGTVLDVLWEGDGWAEVIAEGEKGWVSSQYINK